MTQVHNCPGNSGVRIVRTGPTSVEIQNALNEDYANVLVTKVKFCPFCGMDLINKR